MDSAAYTLLHPPYAWCRPLPRLDLLEELLNVTSHVLSITTDVSITLLFNESVLDKLSLLADHMLNVCLLLSWDTRECNEEL